MRVRREDQARVQLDDGTGWDQMSDLVAMDGRAGDPPFQDLELSRPGGLDASVVMPLLRRVGKQVALLVTLLDPAGQPTSSYAVSGTLREVALAGSDSNGMDLPYDRIVIVPHRAVGL